MFAAFLTPVFFSASSILANRSIRSVGAASANLARISVGLVFLGLFVCLAPLIHGTLPDGGFHTRGLPYMLLSGLFGMGLGDLAMFFALPRIGPRLTVVLTQCLAAPIAAFTEWIWLGTRLSAAELACSATILIGVALALAPSGTSKASAPNLAGWAFGVLSAVGQGLGAVLSRVSSEITVAAGQHIDGITAAFQRILVGFAFTAIYVLIRQRTSAPSPESENSTSARGWRRWRWGFANGLAGPVLGVSCYQWALATQPSGIVLPIVAITPLLVIPLAFWIEGERPTRRSLVGGIIAVAGAIGLATA